MRSAGLCCATLLLALTVVAQEAAPPATEPAPPPAPDFSRDTLVKMFSEEMTVTAKAEPRVKDGFGYIDFRALGMRWHVGYLPFFAPLQGSIPWVNQDRQPNPFLLTHTEYATTERTFVRKRDVDRELKKLEKRLKKDAQITVKPE